MPQCRYVNTHPYDLRRALYAVPAADMLLTVGEGLVGVTIEGVRRSIRASTSSIMCFSRLLPLLVLLVLHSPPTFPLV